MRTGTPSRLSGGSALAYFVALVFCAVALVPVLYVVLGGFRTNAQIATDPAGLPDPWLLDNYRMVLSTGTFWRQLLNSSLVALATTVGVVSMGVMAAFALSRYTFRGRELIFTVFTLGLLFPVSVAILPLYLLLRDFDLLNSLAGVIIPQIAFGLPMTIVILRPFLRAIPVELEDAAMIDGASMLRFFWQIVLPLSATGLLTVGILQFVMSWNAYLLPLVVLGSPTSYTLPLGVAAFSTQYTQDTAAILAFTSLSMLPALVFFTLAERRIVGGMGGAVKG
jgi:raffinose/stachyose/melibiose transport system permease protein